FFFSSRRRHTRSKRDWSSDVCSSDLITVLEHAALRGARVLRLRVERPPTRVRYRRGEGLDLSGLRVCADFDDGSVGEELLPGHGGFSVDCFELERTGPQKVRIRATDGENTRCAVFTVYVEAP